MSKTRKEHQGRNLRSERLRHGLTLALVARFYVNATGVKGVKASEIRTIESWEFVPDEREYRYRQAMMSALRGRQGVEEFRHGK
jgi:hypothetical protein